jgi:hypothetical protein
VATAGRRHSRWECLLEITGSCGRIPSVTRRPRPATGRPRGDPTELDTQVRAQSPGERCSHDAPNVMRSNAGTDEGAAPLDAAGDGSRRVGLRPARARGSVRQRILPAQRREPPEITIGRAQRETMLDRERRQVRIRDQIGLHPRRAEQ